MVKGVKSAASQQVFKDRAKNRVDDLLGIFSDLQSARKESRTIDVALLEEQVHQMLREWKAELNHPSPAASLQQVGSLGFSSNISRLLQLCEEDDDATSALAAPKPEPDTLTVRGLTCQQVFPLVDHGKGAGMGAGNMGINNMALARQLELPSVGLHHELEQQDFLGFSASGFFGVDGLPQLLGYQPTTHPPPCAFLGAKCALWDCPRPALYLGWFQEPDEYCSVYHAGLAPGEGYPGRAPIVRPGGIGLKDNLFFAALGTKAQGKDVGIPECEGAATTKSPWNAPELFDLIILEGERLREWLFFDKPRRAFESGNRKQRSLPDYNGRGWHESRKQVMNEFGGLKRSYYMDPQPMENFEWHLYEYEINKYDACALYRLEVKRVDGKKAAKGKSGNDSVADLQKQLGRLTAEFSNDKHHVLKAREKANANDVNGSIYHGPNSMPRLGDELDFTRGATYDYLVDNIDGYYLT
ncbi:Transcription factor voz1 [Salvia divinorum]|uniref:Transcription factor voz1 n=1 Tax=Salvia divinorum TaxID=28513 RepID=A0ABD1II09_SALDI